MIETVTLLLFALVLIATILLDGSLVFALACGLAIFVAYGAWRGHSLVELARMAARGLGSTGSVLVLFAVIGMLTASWRAAGTIPAITCWSAELINPSTIVLASFALCSLMSLLTGSSFATSATVGVICMTIARSMGANLAIVGGAILSGCFLGERCSPLSSVANLIARLTRVEYSKSIERLAVIAVVPLAACVAIYALLGSGTVSAGATPDFSDLFAGSFDLSWYVLAPIALIVVFSLLKLPVMHAMLASLLLALGLCVFAQGVPVSQLPSILVFGYHGADAALAPLVDGGGILSMSEVALIVGIASTYSGIFEDTGLLASLKAQINAIAERTTPFVGVLLTSLITCPIACDQVVAVMLTSQLCSQTERVGDALALDLTNSTLLLPALIPWSTSVAAITAFTGMTRASIPFACFCYLVPLWTLALSLWQRRHPSFVHGKSARLMGLDGRDDARALPHAA